MSNANYRWKVNLGQEPVRLEAAGASGGLCEGASVSLADEKVVSHSCVSYISEGLPRNSAFLKELARELKKACGAGSCAGEDFVEIQGDRRDRLRELLKARGWIVKG